VNFLLPVRFLTIRSSMELTVELRAKADKALELHQALQALVPAIREEKGCLECRVCRDVEDEDAFCLILRWDELSNLERVMHSGSGGIFLGIVELLTETARIRFGRDGFWEGIDALRRIRKKA